MIEFDKKKLREQLQFYNTKTRSIQKFVPKNPKKVTMYSCGPTVYSYQHIGNLKAALSWDILRRVIRYVGYNLYALQNITDVGHLTDDDELSDDGEDKMIKAAKRDKKTPLEVAQYYTNYYLDDLRKLHIELPDLMPKATEHIPEQLSMIEKLEKNGYTYQTSDGIYFDVSKYKDYGSLSGQKLDEKEAGARVEVNSEKRNPQDFALWKFTVGNNEHHSMKWDSKWGVGFPGWHIECSAMSHKYLGEEFDIHTGGIDHIPIHHENEIAQNTCSHCVKDVTFWMHNGFITFDGEKMSKSLGNVYLLDDLIKKGINPLAYRMLLLQSHYKKSGDISFETLNSANQQVEKINTFFNELKLRTTNKTINSLIEIVHNNLEEFNLAIVDDLNTAKALKNVHEVMSEVNNRKEISIDEKELVISFFETIDQVLAILEQSKEEIPQEIIDLANKRKDAKENKNFDLADQLRNEIKEKGYEIKDDKKVETGYVIHKINH